MGHPRCVCHPAFRQKRWQLTALISLFQLCVANRLKILIFPFLNISIWMCQRSRWCHLHPRGWWHRPIPLGCEALPPRCRYLSPSGYNYLRGTIWKFHHRKSAPTVSQTGGKMERVSTSATGNCCHDCRPRRVHKAGETFSAERADTAHLERFANPNASPLSDDVRLRLNVNNLDTLEKGYLIGAGRISVRWVGEKVLEHIGRMNRCVKKNLLVNFNQENVLKRLEGWFISW